MAREAATTIPKRRGIPFVPTVALSLWRLRQTWRLLLVSGLGVLAAVVLVCAVPLFSQVVTSAGLRQALQSTPDGTSVLVAGPVNGVDGDTLRQAQPRIDRIVRGQMGPYLTPGAPTLSVNLPAPLLPVGDTNGPPNGPIQLVGADLSGDTSAYKLVAGRLPSTQSDMLELAVTRGLADALGVRAGDVKTFNLDGPQQSTVQVRIVGILAAIPDGMNQYGGAYCAGSCYCNGPCYGPGGQFQSNIALASNDTLLALAPTLLPSGGYGPSLFVQWAYPLDLSRVTAANMDDLQQRVSKLTTQGSPDLSQVTGLQLDVEYNLLGAIQSYQGRVIVAQIPIVLLLIQVIGLVLLFISLMVNMLVDRQIDAIAVLRSRGASRGLVLRTMTLQSVGVGVLALVGGPLLSLALVRALGAVALPAADRSALDALADPVASAWGVRWFAFAAAVCAVFAMIVSTRRAANTNVLALRRESARGTRKPLWQRLQLDLVFAAAAVLGYTAYSYIIQQVPSFAKPFLSVLSLFAVMFLLLAVALLFLRFFPLLLRLGARLAARRRAAAPMLAVGQMARSPRQASRMTLLLALSTAFALFALVFAASQAQRIRDVAAYQTGADFTGPASPHASGTAGAAELETSYGAIPGVTAASAVYSNTIISQTSAITIPVQLMAVNADTFARTALWTPQESATPLAQLMAQLAAGRAAATDAIPAVVDQTVWDAFHLAPGARFTLPLQQTGGGSGGVSTPLRLVATAEVAHIPPVDDGSDASHGFNGGSGAILVDLATLNQVYPSLQQRASDPSTTTFTPNQIWLRSADDAAALASVRQALSTGPLKVSPLLDRRQTITDFETDALHIDLLSVLALAAATALALALVGILLGSWLSARGRLTNFALLRALGSEPRQLAGVLLWEQGIIYALSLGLGVLIGAVLSAAVLPTIIFTTGTSRPSNGFSQVLSSFDVPPIQTVVPWQQVGLVLGGLVLICLIAIALMTAQVARPSISQTLRLNED